MVRKLASLLRRMADALSPIPPPIPTQIQIESRKARRAAILKAVGKLGALFLATASYVSAQNAVYKSGTPAPNQFLMVPVGGTQNVAGTTLCATGGYFCWFTFDATGALRISGTISGGGDGAIQDGVTPGIEATVFDYTNANPLSVRLTDLNGDYAAAGAGTQYTEDVGSAADPSGTVPILVRSDTPGAVTTTNGDNVAQRATNYGAAYVQVVNSSGAFVDTFGGGTQYSEGATIGAPIGTYSLFRDLESGPNVFRAPVVDAEGRLFTHPQNELHETFNFHTIDADLGGGTVNRAFVGILLPKSGGPVAGGTSTDPLRIDPTGTTPQPVTGTFWQATQPVSGTVTANAGTNLNTSALLTTTAHDAAFGTAGAADAQVRTVQGIAGGTAIPVSGTFWQGTQPVSGTFWQTTQPVSIASMPSTPVTGTFWQATQPISGTVTANAGTGTMAVSGTFWQATQPVSGTVTANAGTNLNTSSLLTTAAHDAAFGTAGTADTQVRTVQGIAGGTAIPVSGTFWQGTQPVSGTVTANAGSGTFTVGGTVAATQSGTWTAQPGNTPNTVPWLMSIHDGTNKAAVLNLAANDPLAVAIVDGSGSQITSFGGGVQYTEADTDASITGTAVMWEDAADTLRVASAAKPLPVNVVAGGAGDGSILDGVSSAIKATVVDYTNSNPLTVRLTDTNGDYVGAGAGTQYADGAAQATPTGTVALGHDGSNVRAITTDAAGDLQVDVLTMPTVTVTGTVTANAGSGTMAVSGPLTDTQLRATPVPVSGTVTANAGTGTFTVSGTVTANAGTNLNTSALLTTTAHDAAFGTAGAADAQVRSVQGIAGGTALPVSGTFWQGTQPVSGTFWQATQPVSIASMPSTPVTGTFWPTTAASPGSTRLSDGAAFYDAAKTGQLPSALVTGRLDVNIGASSATVPVSGTFWQTTQPISIDQTGNNNAVDVLTLPNVTIGTFPDNEPFNLAQIGGTALSGANVVDAGNTAFRVNCVSGCVAGGSFADSSAFAFTTTPVSNSAFVVDDTGTNTVAENSAGAGRMSTNRIPYFSLHTDAGTAVPFPAALAAGGGLKIEGVAGGVAVPVSGTFWQGTQPVSGTFWQATQPVSIASMPSTPVTGTFWQATQPVSGTFWQATQPVSGTVTANAGTNLNTSALATETSLAKLTQTQGSTTSGQSGPLVLGAVTTSAPSYTTAQSSPLSLTPAGGLRVEVVATAPTGSAPPAQAMYNAGLGSGATGGYLNGITTCDSSVSVNVSTATTTLLITGVSGQHVRICSINLVTNAANGVALIAGTGATCGTSTVGIAGGTTGATGWQFAANGGLTQGSGLGEIMSTKVSGGATGDSLCVVTSAATQLSGNISYAIF